MLRTDFTLWEVALYDPEAEMLGSRSRLKRTILGIKKNILYPRPPGETTVCCPGSSRRLFQVTGVV